VDVEHMVVVFVRVANRPFLDRAPSSTTSSTRWSHR
jgi:hypothetical protein